MAERKEVLDYLRNQQKAAEIEAKINGVNTWVLLGAIAVVAWQLAGSATGGFWRDSELLLRILVLAIGVHMLSWVAKIGPSADRSELRYSRTSITENESPFVSLLKGVLLFMPPAGLFVVAGPSVGTIVLGFLGLIFAVDSIAFILRSLKLEKPSKERFPEPRFGITKRGEVFLNLVFSTLFVIAIGQQIAYFRSIPGAISIGDVREMVLLAVLFLLILIAVERKLQNDGIAWTYQLETDVLVEAVSPEVALRRIESRRLGPRLQDVVDRFCDDLDRRFVALDAALKDCEEKLQGAKQVPEEYPAERAARVKEASNGVSDQLDALDVDSKQFGDYLTKLERAAKNGNSTLIPVLFGLKARQQAYEARVRQANVQLRRLIG